MDEITKKWTDNLGSKITEEKDPRSAKAFWNRANKFNHDILTHFTNMMKSDNPITSMELKALIKSRPEIWKRFEKYIPEMEKSEKKNYE